MGALADKKNPVRGAALGAGIGMTGGLLAPAAAGAAGAGAAGAGAAGTAATGAAGAGLLGDATAAGYGGLTGAGAATMGGGASVAGGSALGSTASSGLLGAMNTYGKPASQAMNLVQQSGLLGGQREQAQASPFIQPQGTGQQVLAQLAQQGDPSQALAQEEMMRRKRRMGLLGREVA